ncbi:hypothetical protein COLO4_29618 [Corchorus olitorius]|uniref:Transcription repressor n=1 Tax=Corchorus olitorius TaxID=93759 RepID=A0A1R3HE05_9ROSI|nr:hypothetical protein COLO4_29618 [Corchorus olitorius]
MKLIPFLSSKSNSNTSWPWPSCHQPRTLSFRTENNNETLFKTINSAYLDAIVEAEAETPESWFSTSSKSASSFEYSTTASDESQGTTHDPVETVIRGLRSETERLFFKPGETSSILEEATTTTKQSDDDDEEEENDDEETSSMPAFKESVVLSMESQDPYVDFRKSMEEMVEALGLKDWDCLEQLLCWYLKANGKSNHGYIFGAFVDLLVGIAISSSSSTAPSCSHCNNSQSPSSPLSFYTSSSSSSEISSTTTPCVSSLEADEEEEIDNNSHSCLSSLSEKMMPGKKEIIQGDDASSCNLDV